MNFALNQSLKIFLTGLIVVIFTLIIIHKQYYNNLLDNELMHTQYIVNEISIRFEQQLIEKVKTTKTLAIAPVILTALSESNAHFGLLSEQKRADEIQTQNKKWKSIDDHDDPFIQRYTNNEISQYLKNQQLNLKAEYGEIFITNKYGALIASTAKLTTFAHGHKYWWKGAYDDGDGAVFFDDRGYDDSVGGYVLGVVVPIKIGNEIIGILKANLNISGSISNTLLKSETENVHWGELLLIRSGGLIVFEQGVESLSKRVSTKLLERLEADGNSLLFKENGNEWLIGLSEVGVTSGIEGYKFGGRFESIDHKKGNIGESWYILNYRSNSCIVAPTVENLAKIIFLGLFMIIAVAFASLLIGYRAAKPLKELIKQTEQIAKGEFDTKVLSKRNDEIGLLAASFNQMTTNLRETTTSIEKLDAEIGERKKVENALWENHEKLRLMIDNSPIGFSATDLKGHFTEVNPALCKMIGYTPKEMINKHFDQFSHPDDKEKNEELYKKLVKGEISYFDLEKRYIHKNGKIIHVRIRSQLIFDNEKNPYFEIAVFEDITERKHAEVELRNSKERFKKLSNLSFEGILIHDKGIPIDVNDSILRMFGYTKKDVIGKNVIELIVSPEYHGIIKENIAKSSAVLYEVMAIKRDGTIFPIELQSRNIIDNGKTIRVTIVRDITESRRIKSKIIEKTIELKKQFEKSETQRIATLSILADLNKTTGNLRSEISVRKQTEQIQKTLFNISNIINTTDSKEEFYNKIQEFLGEIIDTSNLYIALYDESTDSISMEFQVDKQDSTTTFPAGKTLTNYVIKTGKPLFATGELQDKLTKHGDIGMIGTRSEIWLGVPLKIKKKVIGVIALQNYIDPDRYSEKDLEILTYISEEIALSIQHKQDDEEIKKNLREKSTLLQEIYHRTKNNMQVISSMLKMQARETDNEFVKTTFMELNNKIKAMAMVHQKLYQAKDLSNINLKEYVEDLLRLLRRSYGVQAKNVNIKLDLEDVFILIDSAIPLGLILNELISNVFKHAFPEKRKGELSVSLNQDKDKVINIRLTDDGVGIPPGMDLRKTNSMGLQTMFSLIDYQLNGEVSYETKNGLKWHIKLKDNQHKRRV